MLWISAGPSRRLSWLLSAAAALLPLVMAACESSPASPDTSPAPPAGLEAAPMQSSSLGVYAPMAQEGEEEPTDCARSPGFYCQNQDGKNPNMSAKEFALWAGMAALSLDDGTDPGVEGPLDTAEEIAAAVCDTSDQLLRQLATLALNLAAGKLTRETELLDEDDATVGAVFDKAKDVANGVEEVTRQERKALKNVLDRINNNENIATSGVCMDDGDDDDEGEGGEGGEGGTAPPDTGPTTGQKMTVCHKNKKTLTISVSALPAHQAHGDTIGPCATGGNGG